MRFHSCLNMLIAACCLAASSRETKAAYVTPKLGGGQVAAAMKHADINLSGTTLSVTIDPTVPIPLLRPLTPPDLFDPSKPWAVLQGKAHNFQYGWNPSGFWSPPAGSAVWVEQLSASPGLEVYYVEGPPASYPYDAIFGTLGSSPVWKWEGFMVHNAYAVINPTESTYQATYKVYIGDEFTGAPTPGYTAAEATFLFTATPVLTADFNTDTFVDSDDLDRWQQHYSLDGTATNADGDADFDSDVDGVDFLLWQRQYTGAGASTAMMAVPEPATAVLLGVLLFAAWRRER